MQQISPVTVRRAAMDMLARREHSQQELREKLRRKFSSERDLIDGELARLRRDGLQSDARLAEALVHSRTGRGQGPVRIKSELRSRGVSDSEIAKALELAHISWSELVLQVAEKKYGKASPQDAKERAKRSRFLQQRGFSFELINLAVSGNQT